MAEAREVTTTVGEANGIFSNKPQSGDSNFPLHMDGINTTATTMPPLADVGNNNLLPTTQHGNLLPTGSKDDSDSLFMHVREVFEEIKLKSKAVQGQMKFLEQFVRPLNKEMKKLETTARGKPKRKLNKRWDKMNTFVKCIASVRELDSLVTRRACIMESMVIGEMVHDGDEFLKQHSLLNERHSQLLDEAVEAIDSQVAGEKKNKTIELPSIDDTLLGNLSELMQTTNDMINIWKARLTLFFFMGDETENRLEQASLMVSGQIGRANDSLRDLKKSYKQRDRKFKEVTEAIGKAMNSLIELKTFLSNSETLRNALVNVVRFNGPHDLALDDLYEKIEASFKLECECLTKIVEHSLKIYAGLVDVGILDDSQKRILCDLGEAIKEILYLQVKIEIIAKQQYLLLTPHKWRLPKESSIPMPELLTNPDQDQDDESLNDESEEDSKQPDSYVAEPGTTASALPEIQTPSACAPPVSAEEAAAPNVRDIDGSIQIKKGKLATALTAEKTNRRGRPQKGQGHAKRRQPADTTRSKKDGVGEALHPSTR